MGWYKTLTSTFLLMILVLGDNMLFPISPCIADSGNQSEKGLIHIGSSVSTSEAENLRTPPTHGPPRQRCHKSWVFGCVPSKHKGPPVPPKKPPRRVHWWDQTPPRPAAM